MAGVDDPVAAEPNPFPVDSEPKPPPPDGAVAEDDPKPPLPNPNPEKLAVTDLAGSAGVTDGADADPVTNPPPKPDTFATGMASVDWDDETRPPPPNGDVIDPNPVDEVAVVVRVTAAPRPVDVVVAALRLREEPNPLDGVSFRDESDELSGVLPGGVSETMPPPDCGVTLVVVVLSSDAKLDSNAGGGAPISGEEDLGVVTSSLKPLKLGSGEADRPADDCGRPNPPALPKPLNGDDIVDPSPVEGFSALDGRGELLSGGLAEMRERRPPLLDCGSAGSMVGAEVAGVGFVVEELGPKSGEDTVKSRADNFEDGVVVEATLKPLNDGGCETAAFA